MAGISLGTNASSLNAQRRLSDASTRYARSAERLSSGLRINHSCDDPAGLSVAATLNSNSKVYTRAIQNVNDALSFYSTAGEAVSVLTDILSRGKELAVQASNGVYSESQRAALDRELQSLGAEYNRILESTCFNGMAVFSRENGALTMQAGYGAEGTITTDAQTQRALDLDATQRVDLTSSGQQITSGVFEQASSGDGRYVAFVTAAALIADDTDGWEDVYIRDQASGEVQLASSTNTGTPTDWHAGRPSLSSDGRYVTMNSIVNLVTGETGGSYYDIYVKDMTTDIASLVSTTSSGARLNGSCYDSDISEDGRYIVFESEADNAVSGDTNNRTDIFMKDLQTGTLTRVSTSSSGVEGNGSSFNPQISQDGRYVVFNSDSSNLVAGDTNLWDVFVKDMVTGITVRANTSTSGAQANASTNLPAGISADGRYVVFTSSATNLVSGDTNGRQDVFMKDLVTGGTQLVSTSSDGALANGQSYEATVSDDGRFVAFTSSATNLASGHTGAFADAFVKDMVTGNIAILTEGGDANTNNAMISRNGQYVAFESVATNLVSGDTNGLADIFLSANPLGPQHQLSRFQWMSVKTQTQAQQAQDWLDQYMDEIGGINGTIGAALSRFASTSRSLTSATANIMQAESTIRDADIAEETANYVRTRVSQQAATAILAQANQMPAIALMLLGG